MLSQPEEASPHVRVGCILPQHRLPIQVRNMPALRAISQAVQASTRFNGKGLPPGCEGGALARTLWYS